MLVRLLGTGTPAPIPERQGPALLVSAEGERLLFDAGRGVTTQLARAGVAPAELSAILLTHHNYDHIGGLGDLILTAWHGGAQAIRVVGPPGTEAIVAALLGQVYAREIAFSQVLGAALGLPAPDIREVVTVTPIRPGELYQQGACRISAAAVDHGRSLGLSFEEWPCLGYRVEAEGRAAVISGDTIHCPEIVALARGADLLVQCCHRADAAVVTQAHRLIAERVIATSGQAGAIAAEAGVRALALTHLSPMPAELLASIVEDVRRHFGGPVFLGEDLLEIEV